MIDSSEKSAEGKTKKPLPWYIEIPIVVVATLALIFVVQNFIGRMYVIPSQSMEPALHGCSGCTNDRILVEKVSYYFDDPQPGDVVVFKGPPSWNSSFVSQRSENVFLRGIQNGLSYVGLVAPDENNLVKRIIAKGGQTVSCQPGDPAVMVDGKPINNDYVLDPPEYDIRPDIGSAECGGPYFGPVTVPEGNYFVMGDNRTNSRDSRFHLGDEFQGTVPEENIQGKVQAVIYPLSRIGGVASANLGTSS